MKRLVFLFQLVIRTCSIGFYRELEKPAHSLPQKTKKRFLRLLYDGWHVARGTIKEFSQDQAFTHGAALAYYTIFSLPPMLIIIISSLGFFLGQENIKAELVERISLLVGSEPAQLLENVIDHLYNPYDTMVGTIVGIGALLFSSTLVFYSMRNSLNTFWKVREEIKEGIVKLIWDRILAFLMVLSLGVILLVSLLANTLLHTIESFLPDFPSEVISRSENILSISIIFLLFTLIFKYLPNARISIKDAIRGGVFTTLLFIIGEFGITKYISTNDFNSTYGAGGSLIVILAWVFYSSQILFIGAEFVYVYTRFHGREIKPLLFKKRT